MFGFKGWFLKRVLGLQGFSEGVELIEVRVWGCFRG